METSLHLPKLTFSSSRRAHCAAPRRRCPEISHNNSLLNQNSCKSHFIPSISAITGYFLIFNLSPIWIYYFHLIFDLLLLLAEETAKVLQLLLGCPGQVAHDTWLLALVSTSSRLWVGFHLGNCSIDLRDQNYLCCQKEDHKKKTSLCHFSLCL